MQWLRAPSLKSIATLVILTIVLNVAVLLLVLPVKAGAASSWNPGLLANTEAFQTIDDADTAANVRLTFGETLQESLTYNRSASQFEFTRSLKVGGNLTATGSLTITGTGSMSDLTIPSMVLGTPTYSTVKDFMNSFGSAGRKTGGVISDAGSSTVAVTGGTGFIKATDDDNAQLLFFDFPAPDNISIPSNSTRYIGVEYNSGTPQVVARESWNWDLDTEFPLGRVINNSINGADELFIANTPWWVTDGTTNVIEAIRSFGLVRRDQSIGGLMLSVPGTRNIAVSAGTAWSGLNEYDIAAVDTSVAGTVEYYWYKAGSGWQRSDVTQYSVTQWNDITKTELQTMGNSKFGNIWVYGELDGGEAEIALLYPQAQYNTAAEAEATHTPPNVPSHITEAGMLLGRIIFKQNVNVPVAVESAFGTTYNASVTSDHGNLSGLTDDDHSQYLLLSGRTGDQHINDSIDVTGTASGRIVSFGTRLTGSGAVSIRTLTDSTTAFQVLDNDGGNPVFNIDTTNERVGIGTNAPQTALEIIGTASGDLLHAQKSLTSSGSLAWEGSASGASLWISKLEGAGLVDCDTADTSKLLWDATTGRFSCGTDQTGGASGISAADAEGMFVNQGGDTMTGALRISNGAGLNASGSLLTNTNLTINSDNGAADAVLTFGNDAGAETLKFNDTTNQFELSDDLAVTGKLSASDTIAGSGTLAIEGAAAFGSTIKIGGVTYTFPASDGTASGKVLKTDSAGKLSWSTDNATDTSKISASTAEGMFVNQGGDTMTGALQIRPSALGQAELEVAGTASGRILSFGTRLTGSGAVSIRTLIDSTTAFQVFDSDGGKPVFNIDTTNERVGIGTAAPETALEVTGTMSGAALQVNNINGSASAATGSIMIGQAAGSPIWKAPTSALVWYIDGTLAAATSQGATVVLPFGFTCTDIDLRVDTAPAGAALIVDINKAGDTIFSTRPQISDGQTSEAGTHAFSATDLPAGSVITLDIDQVGSGTAGSDLTVILKGTRKFY